MACISFKRIRSSSLILPFNAASMLIFCKSKMALAFASFKLSAVSLAVLAAFLPAALAKSSARFLAAAAAATAAARSPGDCCPGPFTGPFGTRPKKPPNSTPLKISLMLMTPVKMRIVSANALDHASISPVAFTISPPPSSFLNESRNAPPKVSAAFFVAKSNASICAA